jgi:hypothetical protein
MTQFCSLSEAGLSEIRLHVWKPNRSLSYSRELADGPCPEPEEPQPTLSYTVHLKCALVLLLPSRFSSTMWSLAFSFSCQISVCFFCLPRAFYCCRPLLTIEI